MDELENIKKITDDFYKEIDNFILTARANDNKKEN